MQNSLPERHAPGESAVSVTNQFNADIHATGHAMMDMSGIRLPASDVMVSRPGYNLLTTHSESS